MKHNSKIKTILSSVEACNIVGGVCCAYCKTSWSHPNWGGGWEDPIEPYVQAWPQYKTPQACRAVKQKWFGKNIICIPWWVNKANCPSKI